MNVLVTTSTFPRWVDDTGSPFVYELCRRLRDQGLNVVVLAPHACGAQKFEVMEGIKVYRYQYLPSTLEGVSYGGGILSRLRENRWNVWQIPFFLTAQLCALKKIVEKEKVDAIHAHWLIPQGLVAAVYKKFFNHRIRVVSTSHGSDLMALKGFLFDRIKKFVVRQSDKVTAVSTALKEEVRRLVPGVSVEVLPMGVDTARFTPDHYSEAIKTRYGIRGALFLFVGRLSEEKGTEYLIRAMPEVLRKFPLAKLLLIGGGPLEDRLKRLCLDLNVQANVIFVGAVQHESLPAYYATADVLIGPSLREGFGLVFVEAMACGCPVIVSELPGISDIIKNEETGLCCRPADSLDIAQKIIFLLENPQLRQTFRQKGREQVVAKFRWDMIAKCYAQLLGGE